MFGFSLLYVSEIGSEAELMAELEGERERRDPDFQLSSRSFARFILAAESDEQIQEWQRESKTGAWRLVRIPIFVLLLMVFAFVAYSGGDSVLATVPVAVSAAIRMFDTFRGGKSPLESDD